MTNSSSKNPMLGRMQLASFHQPVGCNKGDVFNPSDFGLLPENVPDEVSSGEYSISDSFTDGDSSSEMSESQPGGLNRRLQRKSHHYDNGPIKYREGEVMGFVSTNV
ncbi:unnamed protein product [Heterobilharzia americana]|nr:unnamed protein product [Heterobilharzia americana]